MSDQDRIRCSFLDAQERGATNLYYVDPEASDAEVEESYDLVSALTVATVAQLRRDTALVGPIGTPGGAGAYNTHRDMVTFQFLSEDNGKWPITVSAPNAVIFNEDNETVNALQEDVAAFITWVLEYATAKDGTPFTSFDRGWRWRLNE